MPYEAYTEGITKKLVKLFYLHRKLQMLSVGRHQIRMCGWLKH